MARTAGSRTAGTVGLMVTAALAHTAGGCATQVSRSMTDFPSPARLADVEAKPVTLPSVNSAAVPDDGWAVQVALPTEVALATPWTPQGPWEDALAAAYAASGRKAAVTRALACAAGEVG